MKNRIKALVVAPLLLGAINLSSASATNSHTTVGPAGYNTPGGETLVIAGAQPTPTVGPGDHVVICHALGNGGYNQIAPSSGDVFGHAGSSHQSGADIIPPFKYVDNQDHTNNSLANGQNWTVSGMAIYNNGCVPPTGGQGGGDEDEDTVSLCHATDSNTNPYEKISVSTDGAYNGHYTQHKGDIYPGTSGKWGDIIPPFNYSGHSYSLNWTTAGQATYNNGCVQPAGGMGGGDTNPPVVPITTTPATPSSQTGGRGGGLVGTTQAGVAQSPSGGVGAGEGGGAQVASLSSVVGLLTSLSIAGLGLRRFGKTSA